MRAGIVDDVCEGCEERRGNALRAGKESLAELSESQSFFKNF